MKSKLSDAGTELRSVDQKDRNVMLFNDWLEQNGYEPFADWVKDEDGWKPVVRHDSELQPKKERGVYVGPQYGGYGGGPTKVPTGQA